MSPEIKWTLENIKNGFERFIKENGRLPITPEIDKLDYLPSSKQLQRRFGGVRDLRKLLGYKTTDFGSGKFRKKISIRTGKRGRDTEIFLEKKLREKFGEVFVHTEKIFDDTKYRVDFYIYTPSGNFGIDIFYTNTMKDLQKNVNIKINKYKNFNENLYFIVGNKEFNQKDIDNYVSLKKKALSKNTQIINLDSFYSLIENMEIYKNPVIKI